MKEKLEYPGRIKIEELPYWFYVKLITVIIMLVLMARIEVKKPISKHQVLNKHATVLTSTKFT